MTTSDWLDDHLLEADQPSPPGWKRRTLGTSVNKALRSNFPEHGRIQVYLRLRTWRELRRYCDANGLNPGRLARAALGEMLARDPTFPREHLAGFAYDLGPGGVQEVDSSGPGARPAGREGEDE